MKKIALIGSTGSIGRQVLDVVRRHPDKFSIVAMASGGRSELFENQIAEFKPELSAAASEDREKAFAVAEYANADVVFNAVSGFAGLGYSLRAINAGKNLALANKETLVCGGTEIMRAAKSAGVNVIPVDSEHSAIWQCLNFDCRRAFRRLVITASGGAFRGIPFGKLGNVTPAQALKHPTWNMGGKITVDSATLVNKAYEVIEARVLFGAPFSAIETVIQPQSIIHSLVEFEDGAVLAQLSEPTMEIPIQVALTYPQRFGSDVRPMNFSEAFSLDFQPLVRAEYPLYDLALGCGEQGGAMPCVFNAADEVAVRAFLDGKIKFTSILGAAEKAVSAFSGKNCDADLQSLTETDAETRSKTLEIIKKLP